MAGFGTFQDTGIRVLHTYEDAHNILTNTKPIRGRSNTCIPLGKRHKINQFSIRQNERSDIECVLYNTPVVTFHKPTKAGTQVTIDYGTWASQSSAQFVALVLGVNVRVFTNRLVLRLRSGEHLVNSGLKLSLELNGKENKDYPRWFDADVLDPIPSYIHKINRKAMNDVKKKYLPFTTWYSGMCKLRNDTIIDRVEIAENFFACNSLAPKFVRAVTTMLENIDSGDPEKYMPVFYTFLISSGLLTHTSEYHVGTSPLSGYRMDAKKMMKGLTSFLIGTHRDAILTRFEVPIGQVATDPHAQYFRNGWEGVSQANNLTLEAKRSIL